MAMSASGAPGAGFTALSMAVVMLVPLLAIFLQALIPHFVSKFDIFDLPLLVTIYFSVCWRNPIAGTVFGAIIGLLQDG